MLENIRKNIMGTTSFDMKVAGMRKVQDFVVYPLTEKVDKILIQSDTRWGEIEIATGKGLISKPHSNGANSVSFMVDKMRGGVKEFELTQEELSSLLAFIRGTAGKLVGDSFVLSDNSGAVLV
jgi:hypothetical protein